MLTLDAASTAGVPKAIVVVRVEIRDPVTGLVSEPGRLIYAHVADGEDAQAKADEFVGRLCVSRET